MAIFKFVSEKLFNRLEFYYRVTIVPEPALAPAQDLAVLVREMRVRAARESVGGDVAIEYDCLLIRHGAFILLLLRAI